MTCQIKLMSDQIAPTTRSLPFVPGAGGVPDIANITEDKENTVAMTTDTVVTEIATSEDPVESALFMCQQKKCAKTGKTSFEKWSGWVHKERAFCLVPKEFGHADAQQSYLFVFT